MVWLLYGAGIVVSIVLARLGFVQGKKAPSRNSDHQIIGAVIDARKADEMIRSIDAQTLALSNAAVSAKAMANALDRNTDSLERATGAVNETRQEIIDLTREIVRTGRK